MMDLIFLSGQQFKQECREISRFTLIGFDIYNQGKIPVILICVRIIFHDLKSRWSKTTTLSYLLEDPVIMESYRGNSDMIVLLKSWGHREIDSLFSKALRNSHDSQIYLSCKGL